jgi:hypothetical protein
VRLYVWEDVLTDWSSGMIVALAPDLDTAIALVRDNPAMGSYYAADMGKVQPTVIDLTSDIQPRVWAVHGGG